MTNTEINILDHVNNYYNHLNIDEKVNYVYNNYDFDLGDFNGKKFTIGLSKMNQVREYFKMNQ